MDLRWDCQGKTDIGARRDKNEDQFIVADFHKSLDVRASSLKMPEFPFVSGSTQAHLMLVADGLGGLAAGEVASGLVVETLVRWAVNAMDWMTPEDEIDEGQIRLDLVMALERCRRRLEDEAETDPNKTKMGTTLTMGYLIGCSLFVLHVGDSRCYLWRKGKLRQLTTDHTFAQKLLDNGALSPDEARQSRWKNVLWQMLGASSEKEIQPDVHQEDLEAGDRILLCSDGLNNHVDDARIAEVLAAGDSAGAVCNTLVDEANAAGGKDNITVVAAIENSV